MSIFVKMLIGFGVLVIAGVLAAVGYVTWVTSAPPLAFAESDFVKPGEPHQDERQALFEHCLTTRPDGVATERHSFICGCTVERIAKDLSRAEFVYATHLSRSESRLAMGALKAFAAAGIDRAGIERIGTRASRSVRGEFGYCLQASFTETDLDRIRGELENLGFVPRSTPPPP